MRRGLIAIVAVAVLAAAAPADAAKVTVSTTTDEFGGSVECSLRDAVQSANTNSSFGGCARTGTGSKDRIRMVGGMYPRAIDLDFEDGNQGGDLDITGKTEIRVIEGGVGTTATIDANDMDRVIDVRPGGSLTASSLVLVDGEQAFTTSAAHFDGGGIRVNDDATLDLSASEVLSSETLQNGGNGGGVSVGGTAKLRRVTVSENISSNVGGGINLGAHGQLKMVGSTIDANRADGSGGGGIYLGGVGGETAEIIRSTISRNHSSSVMFGNGGGLVSSAPFDPADFSLTNVTVSGNTAVRDGGGIYVSSGRLTVNAATITDNTADYEETGAGGGGGISGFGKKLVKNSIIADNYSPLVPGNESDCGAGLDRGTHNLVGTDTGCPTVGNRVTDDPLLDPLGDFGGPTFTHKLLAGSPAIGKAGTDAPARDQRGVKRDAKPDIGAFER